MKIQELIDFLSDLKNAHGDINVEVHQDNRFRSVDLTKDMLVHQEGGLLVIYSEP